MTGGGVSQVTRRLQVVLLFALGFGQAAVAQEQPETATPDTSQAEQTAPEQGVKYSQGNAGTGSAKSPADSTPSAGSRSRKLVQEVTVDDVKRFLDPTLMISRLDYNFQANFLPDDVRLLTNQFRPFYAANNSNAFWARIPIHDFSIPNGEGPVGIGDVTLGWGVVLHEDLSRRLTAVAGIFELLLPTGDPAKGTGFDTYILAPGGGIALNPTDKFPIYVIGRYLHSLGGASSQGNGVDDDADRIRSFKLDIETYHILPKGIFLAVLPSFLFNFNQDFNRFSLGAGVGRALNRRLAVKAGYVQHVAGRETFSRGFTVGLTYLWGRDKSKP